MAERAAAGLLKNKRLFVLVVVAILLAVVAVLYLRSEQVDTPAESQLSPPQASDSKSQEYRLTNGDIQGVPIPLAAQFVTADRAPASVGMNQEVYSISWTSDRIISFFDQNMLREGFTKQRCGEFDGVPQCLYRRGSQNIGVEYENGRFVLTEIIQ